MSLVPISVGESPPIVLIHDISGSVFHYAKLCAHPLLKDRLVYGISVPLPGPNTSDAKHKSNQIHPSLHVWAEEYAALIANELKSDLRKSHGQIILGGWSLGGLLATEVTRIFTSSTNTKYQNIAVLGLLLLDSYAPWHLTIDTTDVARSVESRYLTPEQMGEIVQIAKKTKYEEWPGLDDVWCSPWLITPTAEAKGMNGLEKWFGAGKVGTVVRIAEGEEGCDHFSMMSENWISRVSEKFGQVVEEIVSKL